jgi:hypothetical protein
VPGTLAPLIPDVPDEPDVPAVPNPEVPDEPDEPGTPVPFIPDVPDVPPPPLIPEVPDEPDVPPDPDKPLIPEVPEVPDVPPPPPPVILTVTCPFPLFVIVAPLNTIVDTLDASVGTESCTLKLEPNDDVATEVALFAPPPTQTYPVLKDAVNGPFISKEPVICILLVVALAEPVTKNIPSVDAAPNEDVATKRLTFPAPPTQVYPCAKDDVNVPDADIFAFTVNLVLSNVKLDSTNPPGGTAV